MALSLSTSLPLIGRSSTDRIPIVGYGTWLARENEVYEGVKCAIDEGYRHLDCAWVYQNEEEVGRAINEKIASGSISRDDLFVTSKLWNNFHRPELVRPAVQDTLGRLGLNYLDLYLIHFPVSFRPDTVEATEQDQMDQVPLSDTWRALEQLVDQGLVRNIGVSNFEIPDLMQVLAIATKPIAMNQFETHPYYQRQELVDFCTKNDILVTAHTSLGGSANAMKSFHASPPVSQDPTILSIAAKHSKSPAQILLRWALQRPTIVIPKSVTPSRIRENAHLFDFELDQSDMAAIAALDKPGLQGCYCHPRTPWLGRSAFTGSTDHYYG